MRARAPEAEQAAGNVMGSSGEKSGSRPCAALACRDAEFDELYRLPLICPHDEPSAEPRPDVELRSTACCTAFMWCWRTNSGASGDVNEWVSERIASPLCSSTTGRSCGDGEISWCAEFRLESAG